MPRRLGGLCQNFATISLLWRLKMTFKMPELAVCKMMSIDWNSSNLPDMNTADSLSESKFTKPKRSEIQVSGTRHARDHSGGVDATEGRLRSPGMETAGRIGRLGLC